MKEGITEASAHTNTAETEQESIQSLLEKRDKIEFLYNSINMGSSDELDKAASQMPRSQTQSETAAELQQWKEMKKTLHGEFAEEDALRKKFEELGIDFVSKPETELQKELYSNRIIQQVKSALNDVDAKIAAREKKERFAFHDVDPTEVAAIRKWRAERGTSPELTRVTTELADAEARDTTLKEQDSTLWQEGREVDHEEERTARVLETLDSIEKGKYYAIYLADVPVRWNSAWNAELSVRDVAGHAERTFARQQATFNKLREQRIDLNARKTGGLFGTFRMKEEDKRSQLASMDQKLKEVDPKGYPKKEVVIAASYEVQKTLTSLLQDEHLQKMLTGQNISSGIPLGLFVSALEQPIKDGEAARKLRHEAQKKDIDARTEVVQNERANLTSKIETLTKSKEALRKANKGQPS